MGLAIPTLLIEPGRSIVGPAGVALYRIGAIKDIPGVRKYVSVDGGMGDNIRPALYQATYEVLSAGKVNRTDTEKVTIAGKYCESGDVLASDIMLPTPEPGDIVAIPAAGAYCPSMASNYNLNPRPPMVLVNNGQSQPHPSPRKLPGYDAVRCVAPFFTQSRRGTQRYAENLRVKLLVSLRLCVKKRQAGIEHSLCGKSTGKTISSASWTPG